MSDTNKTYNNIEVSDGGIVCDNPNCDWSDSLITFDMASEWINKPCPKCGENLLTEDDYGRWKITQDSIDLINQMSPEDLTKLVSTMDIEEIKKLPIFSSAIGLEILNNLDTTQPITATLETHNEIKFTEFKTDK